MSIIFTRYLYEKEEVILSFITALLNKTSLKECYYWIYEHYFSNFNTFDLLWKVYYDFYFIHYPKLESYIKKKQLLFENTTNNEEKQTYIAFIVITDYCKMY